MSRIALVGLELEGGWDTTTAFAIASGNSWVHHDGSVCDTGKTHQGEISSPPLTVDQGRSFLDTHYPDACNKSCGFHIHVSFKSNADYSILMSKRFYRYFERKWALWGKSMEIPDKHPFWTRLKGENHYCRKRFNDPLQQASLKNKSDIRYSHINYCHALHGTVEFRLLPMFEEKRLSLAAFDYLVELIEKWLSIQKREVAFNVDMSTEDDNPTGMSVESYHPLREVLFDPVPNGRVLTLATKTRVKIAELLQIEGVI
jgi:hypothetical protein